MHLHDATQPQLRHWDFIDKPVRNAQAESVRESLTIIPAKLKDQARAPLVFLAQRTTPASHA
ncbi:hypothetical protein ACFWX5_33505 [[Kitasatospora] papulosa]|uniref:hypothetical protein n=1 Tax=Streptomyces TaxID=1883 RepID=UPI0002C6D8D7|nr:MULTISPECIES: hypothetical protein [unclassified Streptomyces]AGJ58920.1 hypothetical protein F750_6495 [Streptomyces sp. PAMC 26508]QBR09853.1 hypothetical protein D7Y56_30525 [Streptomyces sp. S501]